MKIFEVIVDLLRPSSSEHILVSENDLNNIEIHLAVRNEGVNIDLTGSTVRMAVKKPSGLTVIKDCTITDAINGEATIALDVQAYNEVGDYDAEVYIYRGETVDVTGSFKYTSIDAIMSDNTLESTNDWQVLHESLLTYDKKPLLIEGAPTAIPEYKGQMALDTITGAAFIAIDLTSDSWRTVGGGGGTGGGGPVYWNDILSKPTSFTPSIHTHLWNDITDKPTTFAPNVHTHDYNDLSNIPTTFTPSTHTHAYSSLTGIPTTFTPSIHSHGLADITGLSDALDGKSDVGHSHDWNAITGKPTAFTPITHNHPISEVTGLQAALNSKLESIPAEYLTQTEGDDRYELKGQGGGGNLPSSGTTNPSGAPLYIGQIYINTTTKEAWIANSMAGDWQTISMDETGGGAGSVTWDAVTEKPATFPPDAHTHAYSTLTGIPTEFTPIAHNHTWANITGTPTTLSGYGITDATPSTHIGSGGTAHAAVTTGANGFMTAADKTKLNGIATGATLTADSTTNGNILINGTETNIYSHPTGDGNLHVPATSTTNNNKVLKAGATAGSIAWSNVDWAELTGKPATYTPESHTHAYNTLSGIPTTFTPPIMSGSDRGGARVGNGLAMSTEYLFVKTLSVNGTKIDPVDNSIAIDRTTVDTWYAAKGIETTVSAHTTALNGLKLWSGTQADYELLTKDPTTLYFITG